MPNWVINIIEVEGDDIQEMLEKIKSEKSDFDFEKIIPMPESENDNWYKWSLNNWGTKWTASDVIVNGNLITFETAWDTPFNLIMHLSIQFPNLSFDVKYADENVGSNCGKYKLKNGCVLEDYEGSLGFSCEVLGLDPADYDISYYRDKMIDKIINDES